MKILLFMLLGTMIAYSFNMFLKAPTKAQLKTNTDGKSKKPAISKKGWFITSIFLLVLTVGIMCGMFANG